jgi:ribonuclease HI
VPIAVLHLDESCLGNGQARPSPGGAGGLIETRTGSTISRRDFFIHAPDTTNNRMALSGAIAALQLLGGIGRHSMLIVSDSEYLIKGIREWIPGWISRGWKRKAGPIENLELWQTLVRSAEKHDVQWTWVRGHVGHAKNEYANDLAVAAATNQATSTGMVDSEFPAWLAGKRSKGQYAGYDADATFTSFEQRLAAGGKIPLAESR